jgi:spore coat polysaccharide biosynthesis protein SpsF
MTRVVAIIQARMGSTRLPGKVLLDIAGQAMLTRVLTRASRSASLQQTLVATTTDASDDALADYCGANHILFTRGSNYDVLDRYYQAALSHKADVIIRITADCPVIDPALVDDVVDILLREKLDFACNRLPPPFHRTYPIGLDTEACTFFALERAWKEARKPEDREHVMPYFYENTQLSAVSDHLSIGESPRGFHIALLNHIPDYGSWRWTVDTAEDLEFIRQIYIRFAGRDDFAWQEVLELLHHEPHLMEINADVKHKTLRDIDRRALKK